MFPPPPVPGLGQAGGFKLQIQDRHQQGHEALNAALGKVMADKVAEFLTKAKLSTGQVVLVGGVTRNRHLVDFIRKGLRVFLRDGAPLEAVAKRLESAPRANHSNGDGEVSVVLLLNRGTEVEVKLPGRFKVSPQIAGAIKAVPGVVQVEAL